MAGKHRAEREGYSVSVSEIVDLLGVAAAMLRDSLSDEQQFEHRDNDGTLADLADQREPRELQANRRPIGFRATS